MSILFGDLFKERCINTKFLVKLEKQGTEITGMLKKKKKKHIERK